MEDGECRQGGYTPLLYRHIDAAAPKLVRKAEVFAAGLTLPTLQLYAVRSTPKLDQAANDFIVRSEADQASRMPDGTAVRIKANVADHLAEDRSPELLRPSEATLMYIAGVELIKRGLALSPAEAVEMFRERKGGQSLGKYVRDVDCMRAGTHLVADAVFADEKCSTGSMDTALLVGFAQDILRDAVLGRGADNLLCNYTARHMLVGAGVFQPDAARVVLDLLLSSRNWKKDAGRAGLPAVERDRLSRFHGRLLMLRSFD